MVFVVAPAASRAEGGRGLLLVSLVAPLLALACGGAIGGPDGAGGSGGTPVLDGVGGLGSGGLVIEPGTGGRASGGREGTGGTPFIEPECPETPPPPVVPECDPLDPTVGCPSGQGCYPFLVYPNGEGCGFPTFGAQCAPSSTGGQGEVCGMGTYCEPGFMCVIGATAGARCTQICSLVEPSGCPAGLVCNETDVLGYGVCF